MCFSLLFCMIKTSFRVRYKLPRSTNLLGSSVHDPAGSVGLGQEGVCGVVVGDAAVGAVVSEF